MVSFDSAALWNFGECLECRVMDTFTSAPDFRRAEISAIQTYSAPESEQERN